MKKTLIALLVLALVAACAPQQKMMEPQEVPAAAVPQETETPPSDIETVHEIMKEPGVVKDETTETTTETSMSGTEISIVGFEYPAEMNVKKGDTVTWKNNHNPHTVSQKVAKGQKGFDSGVLLKDQSWSYTFSEPGTYEYYCKLHPFMKGKIVVTE